MGLGEDMASASLQIAKEVAPELLKVLFKGLEVTGCIAGGTSKLVWSLTFKDKWQEIQTDKERLKLAGEQPVHKFLYKYQDVKSRNIDEYAYGENREAFNKIMLKYRIPYAIQNTEYDMDKNGVKDVYMYIPKEYEYIWMEAEKELKREVLTRELRNDEQIKDTLEDYDISVENVDLLPKEAKKEIASKVEAEFLEGRIQGEEYLKEQVRGAKGESLIVRDDFAIADMGEKFKYVSQSHQMDFDADTIRAVMKSQGIELNMNNEQINATMRDYIKSANQELRLMKNQVRMEQNPLRQDFLMKTMIDKTQNPNMKIEAIKNEPKLSKMIRLREANRYGLSPKKLLENGRSEKQIQALTFLKGVELQHGELKPGVKEIFRDKDVTGKEIDAMMNEVVKNPNVKASKLEEIREKVQDEQDSYELFCSDAIERKPKKHKEKQEPKRKSLDEISKKVAKEKERVAKERKQMPELDLKKNKKQFER